MSELSLIGHEAALADLTDQTKMPNERLQMHISELESIKDKAMARNIGRQVEVASRLLMHFGFEQAQRNGISGEQYAGLMEMADSQDYDMSELADEGADAVAS